MREQEKAEVLDWTGLGLFTDCVFRCAVDDVSIEASVLTPCTFAGTLGLAGDLTSTCWRALITPFASVSPPRSREDSFEADLERRR